MNSLHFDHFDVKLVLFFSSWSSLAITKNTLINIKIPRSCFWKQRATKLDRSSGRAGDDWKISDSVLMAIYRIKVGGECKSARRNNSFIFLSFLQNLEIFFQQLKSSVGFGSSESGGGRQDIDRLRRTATYTWCCYRLVYCTVRFPWLYDRSWYRFLLFTRLSNYWILPSGLQVMNIDKDPSRV